jgi:hypothetical protein
MNSNHVSFLGAAICIFKLNETKLFAGIGCGRSTLLVRIVSFTPMKVGRGVRGADFRAAGIGGDEGDVLKPVPRAIGFCGAGRTMSAGAPRRDRTNVRARRDHLFGCPGSGNISVAVMVW